MSLIDDLMEAKEKLEKEIEQKRSEYKAMITDYDAQIEGLQAKIDNLKAFLDEKLAGARAADEQQRALVDSKRKEIEETIHVLGIQKDEIAEDKKAFEELKSKFEKEMAYKLQDFEQRVESLNAKDTYLQGIARSQELKEQALKEKEERLDGLNTALHEDAKAIQISYNNNIELSQKTDARNAELTERELTMRGQREESLRIQAESIARLDQANALIAENEKLKEEYEAKIKVSDEIKAKAELAIAECNRTQQWLDGQKIWVDEQRAVLKKREFEADERDRNFNLKQPK